MAIEYLDEVATPIAQKKRGIEYVDAPESVSKFEYLDEMPAQHGGRGASGSWTPNTSATGATDEITPNVGPYPKAASPDSKSMDIYRSGLDAFLNGDRTTAGQLANEAYRLDPKNIEARNLVERMQRDPTAGTVKPSWNGNNSPVIPKTEIPSPSVAVNFVKGLPGLARDIASQSAREIGSSGAYMGAGTVRGATMGYVDPTSLIEKSSYLSGADISKQAAENVGSMIGVIAPIAAISKGVGAGLKTAQVFNTVRPWIQNIFQAGVTGGVFGASRKPGENESRAQNAADDAGLFMAFTGTAQAIQRAFVKDVLIPDAKKAEVLQKATDAGIDAYAKGGSKSEAGRVFTETLDTEAKAAREAVKAGEPGTHNIQSPGYKEPATVVKTPTALSNAINRIIERIRKPSVGLNQPIDAISSAERQAGGIGQDVAPIDSGPASGYDLGGRGEVPNTPPPGGLSVSRGMVPSGPASPSVPVAPGQSGTPSSQISANSQPAQGMAPPPLTGNETSQSASSPTGEVSPSEPVVAPTKKFRIPKAEIEGYAEYLWRQAIEERNNAAGLEKFIIENNGMRSNDDTKEEFQSVPIHLRGVHPVDEMRQMAVDAGFQDVPDDLNYWAGGLKKRGPIPKKYMFLDQAKRELENEYETYGPPSQRNSGPQIDLGNAEPIPFETKAPYGVKEQGDLFAAPKENIGQSFDRLVAHAKQQGFSQPEAMAYAKRTLAAQGRGAEGVQGGLQATQREMGVPGGVEGFGRGQKGQHDLFSMPSGGMSGVRQFFDFIRAGKTKAAEAAIRSVDTPTLVKFTNSKEDGHGHPYLRQEVSDRFVALRNVGEVPQKADFDEWVKNGGTLSKGNLFEGKATYGTNAPVFYSQLQRTIEEKMPNSAPAVMVRNLVDPAKGNVKAEEVEWSGIKEWLLGKDKVSKAEVLDFLKSNEVQIKEVELSDKTKINWSAEKLSDGSWQVRANGSDVDNVFAKSRQEAIQRVSKSPNLEDLMSDYPDTRPQGRPKFSKYQLPGGENYREVLLTLPHTYNTGMWHDWASEHGLDPQETSLDVLKSNNAPNDVIKSFNAQMFPATAPELFSSSHFNEPNILAHVRMNDRTTADGKKVLFLEEVQSDWHQQGREKGYSEKPNSALAEYEELTRKMVARTLTPQEKIRLDELRPVARGQGRQDGAVPNAPFKKTWYEMAIKRMLRYAVDNGYDGIAWTTGEQQAERYDLSKQVDSISWAEIRPGVKGVTIRIPNGEPVALDINDDGIGVVRVSSDNRLGSLEGKNLSDVVGKDLSKKILSERRGDISGDGLKVGGEGMKGFYDKIIPSFLNKYVKKWGGRVGESNVGGTVDVKKDMITGKFYVGENSPQFDTREKADKWVKENTGKVHSLTITPAMRESVSQGQSMFEKKSPYAASQGQIDLWRPTGEGQHQRPVDIPKALRESVVVKDLQETGFLDVHTTTITSPEDTAAIFSFMQNNTMESMYAIGMDGAGKMLGVQMVGMGNINQIPLSTRDTLAGMHAMGAAKVSFVHNHPSHDASPSKEDIGLTIALANLAKSVDMEVLHHVVINDKTFGLIGPDGQVEMRPFSHKKPAVGTVKTVAPKQKWDSEGYRATVNQPEIAADLLFRFQQEHPGVVLLALNTKNKVNSIWHVSSSLPLDSGRLVAEIGKIAMRNAAVSVIVSTNENPNSAYIKAVKSRLSPWGVDLLDWVGYRGGFTQITSARKQGIIGEGKESYGKVDQTQTPAFRAWFGNSVVTDSGKPISEGGKPLVVYHGTTQAFRIFDPLKRGRQTQAKSARGAYWFTSDADNAHGYTELGSGRVADELKARMEMAERKAQRTGNNADWNKYHDMIADYESEVFNNEQNIRGGNTGANIMPVFLSIRNPLVYDFKGSDYREETYADLIKKAKADGNDGVIFKNTYDPGSFEHIKTTVYGIFNNTQIKSATGNRGTFGRGDPDILKESGPGYGGKPPTPPLSRTRSFGSGDAYEVNRLLAKKGSFTHYKASDIMESAKNFAETLLTPISTVLKNIDPSLKGAIRHHAFAVLKNTHDDLHAAMPLMKKADMMPREDQADLDLAGKNSDVEKIKEILSKHGAWAEYDAYRRAMNMLRNRAIDSGVDMGYLSDYFPRIVQDKSGFLEAIQADTRWPDISALIEQAETGGILSDEDKVAIINNYLRGYSQGVINIKTPGNVKTRTIAILSPRMNQFYMDWRPAAIRYMEGMNKMIGDRLFFGKSAKNSDEGPDLFGLNKNKIDTEKSIGFFVKDAVDSRRVKKLDEPVLRNTLDAYFNQKSPDLAMKIYRDITTAQTIGNMIAALTQLQDIGFSLYRAPWQSIPKLFKAFANRSDIKLQDLGLESIAEEFSTRTRLSRAVATVFKLSGLTGLDRITAETSINAIVSKYRSQARRGMAGGLEERLRSAVGDRWKSVAEDLANGNTSKDILELAFNEILDIQPKALTELPRGYLKGGNARIFYMLKTFQLRQLDFIRAEAFSKMAEPGLKNKAIGMGRLISIIATLGAVGVATDELKDWVLGRKTKISDTVIDNILKLAGLSKWTIYKAREEGMGSALMKTILPPAPIIDQLWKDVATAGDRKGVESVQSIPLVGKPYYWRFGRGRKKTLAKHPELQTSSIDSRGRTLRPRQAPTQRPPLRQRVMVKR